MSHSDRCFLVSVISCTDLHGYCSVTCSFFFIRSDKINDSITHVVMGDHVNDQINQLKDQQYK